MASVLGGRIDQVDLLLAFTNTIPTFEEVERVIRRRIRQYQEWTNAHPKDYLGDEDPAALLIRWLPEVRL